MNFRRPRLVWLLFGVVGPVLIANADVFSDVDSFHQMTELSKPRGSRSFGDTIAQQIRRHFRKSVPSLGGNEELFRFSGPSESVSLLSHRFCDQTAETLTTILGHTPSPSAVELAQEAATRLNAAREKTLSSRFEERVQGRLEAADFFSRLMGCLAYTESLTTADTERSKALAKRFVPRGYDKPDGVKFYYDQLQKSPKSRLNIGLYQFSPDSRGNVRACIDNWNRISLLSPLSRNASFREMVRALGDESQTFNAFCGVNKIAQIFLVQVNSTEPKRTHPQNWILDAQGEPTEMKAPSDRCVSLHFNGRAYNHFGPLQNSTKKNLEKLLRCALDRPSS